MLVLVGAIILVVVILLDAAIFGYFIFRRNRREQATNKDTPDEEGDISQLGDPSSQSTEESSDVEHGRRERESVREVDVDERQSEFDEDDDDSSSVSTLKTAMSGLGSIL